MKVKTSNLLSSQRLLPERIWDQALSLLHMQRGLPHSFRLVEGGSLWHSVQLDIYERRALYRMIREHQTIDQVAQTKVCSKERYQ